MAVTSTDLLLIERGGTLYKATAADLVALTGGGATLTAFTDPAAFTAYTPGPNEVAVLEGDGFTFATGVAAPATPAADNVTLYGTKVTVARDLPLWKDPAGLAHPVQGWLGSRRVAKVVPIGGSTTVTALGAVVSGTGTATAATMAATNIHTALNRLNYLVTTASTSAVAGWRQSVAGYFIGAAASALGGFHYVARFGRPTGVAAVATLRGFTGFAASTGAPTDVNPSTLVSMIGVGCDAADANYQIMHNDATGTATKIDTGFPKNTADATEMYELQLYAARGRGGRVDYVFKRLSDGASVSGSITTDLPTDTTMLAPRGWHSVGGTSSVVGYSLGDLTIEGEW